MEEVLCTFDIYTFCSRISHFCNNIFDWPLSIIANTIRFAEMASTAHST